MSLPPSYNLLKQYPNPVYFETGMYRGDSIQLALDAGFSEIHSLEVSKDWVAFCRSRFSQRDVHLHHGDSATDLWHYIEHIQSPITFFLDSHSQLLEGEQAYDNPFPLLDELRQIGKRSYVDTIIIDDILHLTHPDITGWSRSDIELALLSINPDYEINYIANPVKGNICIAHVPT